MKGEYMRDITRLHPELQMKIRELMSLCEENNLKIDISECLRTAEEQNELYAKGRTKPGRIVTNANGSEYLSMHQWGIAFDFYRIDGKGAYNEEDDFFIKVGRLGESIGLEWGGSWTSFVDKPHFQLPDWGTSPQSLIAIYKTPENFIDSWEKYWTRRAGGAETGVAGSGAYKSYGEK